MLLHQRPTLMKHTCEFRLRAVSVLSKCFAYSVASNARRVSILIDFIMHSNATVKLAFI